MIRHMRNDDENVSALTRRAVDAFGDAVQELVRVVTPFFMEMPIHSVRVSEDLGLALSMFPDKVMVVMTAAGMVQSTSSRTLVASSSHSRRSDTGLGRRDRRDRQPQQRVQARDVEG